MVVIFCRNSIRINY